MAFVFRFEHKHPERAYTPGQNHTEHHRRRRLADSPSPETIPPLAPGIEYAKRTVTAIPEVKELPPANKDMILHMAAVMMRGVNASVHANFRGEAFWGLYLLTDPQHTAADQVGLLSVGTFGQRLSFTSGQPGMDIDTDPLGSDVYRRFYGLVPPTPTTVGWSRRTKPEEYSLFAHTLHDDTRHVSVNVVDIPAGTAPSLEAFMSDYETPHHAATSRLPLVQLSAPQDTFRPAAPRHTAPRYY